MNKKIRLDVLLVERGLAETREKAKRTIMAGLVYSDQIRMDKPGMKVDPDISLKIKGNPLPYVSRGGLKLEKALKEFHLSVDGKIMMDVGSSTGGFTDCALQNGAKLVYAIDTGYNQLAWKLRNDERVIVMEKTNFRYVTAEDLTYGIPEFATIDVSFISLKLILPVIKQLMPSGSDVFALIKPQFEAGRDQVGKKGIIRDPDIHLEVIQKIISYSLSLGFFVHHLTYSPITGGDGNIEFLIHVEVSNENEGMMDSEVKPEEVVLAAHQTLKKESRTS
ncbi:23S rRNA (cytidine1920-2'-O)/16S rRNA (cytidine1409-2'-O)-methyltransferase [Melghiribacillus thermohalophilus]|uniref:23S rRNA (Cytidine1920-2'-O)/16S rRNA (Cytidine1409-2'-O)-methyltransferase n=1 Tax=Melghiribacillus thermohalophilus TaxID=1324956 RepID=A0A4V2V1V7_9BACI|nr:TlyA family RNA methyltransferase [Melghiribacillus thermohalophilus]TCT22612.1 23S rRNA (cytidine1920-2'-O)/16S rRNA (cytidine1409-2'-O)-methyltransferase [Melghiribacillus thermohalophilus]